MNSSKTLGLIMLAPAIIIVVLFFLLPVALTAAFSFTNMSTATGISGGAYQITPGALQKLAEQPDLAAIFKPLAEPRYVVDEAGLKALAGTDISPDAVTELRAEHLGEIFATRLDAERMIKTLAVRPSTHEVKEISEQFNRSVINTRFDSRDALIAAIKALGVDLTTAQADATAAATYTGWTWTNANFLRMVSTPDTARILINTLLYVGFVLVLFNTAYAMVLALATYYMPSAPAGIFRTIWLLPRISPPVIYVLLWKWLAWDTGFIATFLGYFGIPAKNWLLDSSTDAWVFVILINGFVGASMGMLVFSSALRAIPRTQFYASEVDGANRWQQIRHIILPQMRWPILFVTCYQTLSLLTSFDLILLSTNGGPGGSTEVWALATYHEALNNYAGNLEYGFGAAMALVLVVIGVVLSLVYLRFFNYRALVAKPLIEH